MHQENLVVGSPYGMFDLAVPRKQTLLLSHSDRSLFVDWVLDFVALETNSKVGCWCEVVPEFLWGTFEAGRM